MSFTWSQRSTPPHPGEPPRGSSDDDQFCALPDGPAGSTRSSAMPVASSNSTRCQSGS